MLKRICIYTFISIFLAIGLGFAQDQEYEKFKEHMKRYNRENPELTTILERYSDAICVIRYTIKEKKSKFQYVSSETFGGDSISETEKYIQGNIVSPDGHIIFNGSIYKEAMEGAAPTGTLSLQAKSVSKPYNFKVYLLSQRRSYPAEFVSVDRKSGLAILKIKTDEKLPYLDIQGSNNVINDLRRFNTLTVLETKSTSEIAAITNPLELLGGDKEQEPVENVYEDFRLNAGGSMFYQLDSIGSFEYIALSTPVKSGSALFDNYSGEFIGIASTFATEEEKQKNVEGLSEGSRQMFSISVSPATQQITESIVTTGYLKSLIEEVKNSASTMKKGWTGISSFQPVNKAFASALGIPSEKQGAYGIIASQVEKGSQAYKAGLRSGDIIISFNDKPVSAADEEETIIFKDEIQNIPPGEEISATFVRLDNGKLSAKQTISFDVETAPKDMYSAETYFNKAFGALFTEITRDRVAKSAYLDETYIGNVMVKDARSGGWFQMGGLNSTDVILKVGDKDINNISDIKNAFSKVEEERPLEIPVLIKRAANTKFVKIKPNWSRMK